MGSGPGRDSRWLCQWQHIRRGESLSVHTTSVHLYPVQVCYEDLLGRMAVASGIVGPIFVLVVLRLAPVSGDISLLPRIDDVNNADSIWWRVVSVLLGLNICTVIKHRFGDSWQQNTLVDLGVFNRTPEYSWLFDATNYSAKIALALLFVLFTTRLVFLSVAYFFVALALTLGVYFVPPYQNQSLNTTLLNLRAVVTFTCGIGIGITIVNDSDDPRANYLSIAWWVGVLSAISYYVVIYYTTDKRKQVDDKEEQQSKVPGDAESETKAVGEADGAAGESSDDAAKGDGTSKEEGGQDKAPDAKQPEDAKAETGDAAASEVKANKKEEKGKDGKPTGGAEGAAGKDQLKTDPAEEAVLPKVADTETKGKDAKKPVDSTVVDIPEDGGAGVVDAEDVPSGRSGVVTLKPEINLKEERFPKASMVKWRGILSKQDLSEEEAKKDRGLTKDICCAILAHAHLTVGCEHRHLAAAKLVLDKSRDDTELDRAAHVLRVLGCCASEDEIKTQAEEAMKPYLAKQPDQKYKTPITDWSAEQAQVWAQIVGLCKVADHLRRVEGIVAEDEVEDGLIEDYKSLMSAKGLDRLAYQISLNVEEKEHMKQTIAALRKKDEADGIAERDENEHQQKFRRVMNRLQLKLALSGGTQDLTEGHALTKHHLKFRRLLNRLQMRPVFEDILGVLNKTEQPTLDDGQQCLNLKGVLIRSVPSSVWNRRFTDVAFMCSNAVLIGTEREGDLIPNTPGDYYIEQGDTIMVLGGKTHPELGGMNLTNELGGGPDAEEPDPQALTVTSPGQKHHFTYA